MQKLSKLTAKSSLFVSALLGGVIFTSCASIPQSANQDLASAPVPAPGAVANLSQKAEAAPQLPRSRPQLIKKAAMTVIVNSVDKSIDTVTQIINRQQGDLIGLNEQQPTKENFRHIASNNNLQKKTLAIPPQSS
jgi:hypothetical protein